MYKLKIYIFNKLSFYYSPSRIKMSDSDASENKNDQSAHDELDSSAEGELDEIESKDSCDVLKILVTTDNHLGYMEKDSERGNNLLTCQHSRLLEDLPKFIIRKIQKFMLKGNQN